MKVAPPASLIGSLIDRLSPTAETFECQIGDTSFTFRYVKDGDEWETLKASAAQWAKAVGGKGCPPDLKADRVSSIESLVWCSILAALSIGAKAGDATEGPVPPGDWLKLAKHQPLAFETVWSKANDEITGNVRLKEQEEILEGKGG